VHLNTPSLACADYGRPVVVGLHSCLATWWRAVKQGPMPADFAWRTELTAEGLRRADARVCPTIAFAAEAGAVYGAAPQAVHNGREQPPLTEAAGPCGAFAFAAGRFWDEGKGLATLVAAAPAVDIPVVVAGPLTGPNGAQASAPGVVALGAVDEEAVRQRLAQRPIFVSTAVYEPFGLSVLEAAQAGCPLVLSDIATFRELWSRAALFVPPRDAGALARALNMLAADDVCREQLAAAARERAARYTVEAMARDMMGVYENLLAARAGAAA
jgi:glycosyltransferase involved in cell wall biosynthesis